MMKKPWRILFGLVFLFLVRNAAAEGVPIDEAHFPDRNFRGYVQQHFDRDGNSFLSQQECEQAEAIDLSSYSSVRSVEGIACFPKLRSLNCYNQNIDSLDLSGNPNLQYLNVYLCGLSSLDVSMLPKLQELRCENNNLTELNLLNNPNLQWLRCGGNALTALDTSANPLLYELICSNNPIHSLDLSKNTALTELHCFNTELVSLDVSALASLRVLAVNDNHLTSLNLKSNARLQTVQCSGNTRTVTVTGNTFDLSSLPGFDPEKAGNWEGGWVSGSILTVAFPENENLQYVTYNYDCGNGKNTFDFTLCVRRAVLSGTVINLPASLKAIEDEAFFGVSTDRIMVPEGVEAIGERAFANMKKQTYVFLPDSVREIHEYAFYASDVVLVCPPGSWAENWGRTHGLQVMNP